MTTVGLRTTVANIVVQVPDPQQLGGGTASAPTYSFADDTGSGLYRPADNQVALRANNAVEWRLDGSSTPAGPRSYIVDATGTKATLTLTRGTSTSDGNVPDSTYTGALMVDSYNAGNSTNYISEAIKGSAYAAEGAGGNHYGVFGTAQTPSAGTWTASGSHSIIGVVGQATGYKDSSRTWGGNFKALQLAGASGVMSGVEIGVGATVAPTDRCGVLVVTLSEGALAGTGEDIGMKFVNKNAVDANRWADAVISFNSPADLVGDGWPAQSTATLIKAYNGITPTTLNAAAGIDFSEVTFSGNSFDANRFKVKGNGRVSINTNTQTTEAPLYIDATGEAYALRIDGFTIQASAGASAGYLELRRGSTTYKIQLYANA